MHLFIIMVLAGLTVMWLTSDRAEKPTPTDVWLTHAKDIGARLDDCCCDLKATLNDARKHQVAVRNTISIARRSLAWMENNPPPTGLKANWHIMRDALREMIDDLMS
jgi:hypothetical protein